MKNKPILTLLVIGLLMVLSDRLVESRVAAAEYSYTYVYNGGTNVNYVWWDDATANVQGVIIHMNYAAGAGLYYNGNWRSFAASRNFAMMLSINQDSLASASDGVNVVVSNTLKSVAVQSGHAELTAWQPYIFSGLSRGGGGANGSIAQGWIAGTNRTIACLAYHGNSLVYNLYADTASKKAIPVLYLIASLDDPAQGRQGDIEDWVRQGAIYGYSVRLNGALWTTSMQYGVVHNSTGDDTYILQWLGRCIDARLDNSNRGKLKPIVLNNCHGVNYTMANANTYNCAFTNISVASAFVQSNKMIWLPPGNDSEWLWENATPRISSITSSTNVAYLGQPSPINVSAYTPNSEAVTYQWHLISKPVGGSAMLGNSNAASTTVTFSGAQGLYTLQALVTSDPGITNSAQVVYQVVDASLRYYWQGNGVTNAWDFTSTNWLYQGQPATYADPGVTAGSVVFSDAGSASPAVTLSIVVQPTLVTFSNVANSYTLSGAGRISGAAALVLVTPGAVTLLTTNDYGGPTTIAAGGMLQVGNGAFSGSIGSGNVTNNGQLNFNVPDKRAVAGRISGSGALTMIGPGTLNLLQTNTYAGPTTITNGGAIRLGNGAAASLPVTRGLSYWLDMSVTNNLVRNGANVVQINDLTGNGNSFFVASGGTGATLLYGTNGINGLAVLHFAGSDAERLVLSNSSSSQTVFFSCRVIGSSSGADGIWGRNGGDNGIRVASGTSWAFPGNGNDYANGTGGAMYVNGVATNIFVTAQPQVLTAFAGSNNGFPWAQTGLGSYFNGRDFRGDIGEVLVYNTVLTPSERQTVEGYLMAKWGITAPAAINVLPAGTALAMGSGSRLDLTNSSQNLATLTGAGMITNSGLANVQLTIGVGLFSGPIGGALGLTVAGPGTLTLSGTNTYTGNTVVSNGMLLVNGALGTNAVSVLNGVLGGGGKLAGAVTMQGGVTLAPGPVPGLPGKLAITGKYAVSNAAAVLAIDLGGTTQADGSGSRTNIYDFVSIGGAAVLNGSLNLRLTNSFMPSATDSFTILTAAGGLGGAFTNVLGGRVAVAKNVYGSFLVTTTATSVVLTNFQVSRPVIGNISMSGGQIMVTGTNGVAGGNYYVLSTTNLALPATNWSVMVTNQFSPDGSFIFSNSLNPNTPQTFYRLWRP